MIATIITIHLFFATVYLVIKEPEVVVKNKKVVLDYARVSLGVLGLLLASGIASLTTIKSAIMPQMNIVPWQILIIFFGSAYICGSLDASGVLKLIAYKFASVSKNGKRLFINLVLLAGILTVFTSNDIVTLTLTPIIVYISQYTNINPMPYLIAVFFASNTWSMFFYIGNPTNVVVAQAYSLNFMEYAKLMFFPTIVAILTSFFGFYFKYRNILPGKLNIAFIRENSRVELQSFIKDTKYTFLSTGFFVLFFITIAIGDLIGLQLWKSILLFSGIYLLLNTAFSDVLSERDEIVVEIGGFEYNLTFLFDTVKRVPWKMLPLVLTFFVFVHIFTRFGITRYVGSLFNFQNELIATIITTFTTAFAANVMINQPMTIFFAQAFYKKPINYAMSLIVGSNIGGNITLIGALAGVMWSRILKFYGIEMNNKIFVRETFFVALLVLFTTSIAIYMVYML
ncbi:Na+/H+ antiporter NhaD-like permease [Fervidobacterium pennivorans DSM 9078]|jgi:arsenical pump membrane protein|uniref:Na+/H+ antiporter NhaD-like permease n=1 Tax=Fervidobacterium pennivorans (strain DSM 9078 / Ven5) TaxID=771875 RepID=H9UAX4_FERPD|nr:SLC13 family permease [Fervidobacterium pennivorans]AFG34667.1 Na+/H+ antiporter NhaD-like permease [Fervidobacterium pennivorans DSM 9078]QIV77976.1 arsenic transporter [Fervidobacterium pennivorans subsp. keratinolyticus]